MLKDLFNRKGCYILVKSVDKDKAEVVCMYKNYRQDKTLLNEYPITDKFYSKESIKNTDWIEHDSTPNGWHGESSLIFDSALDAQKFLNDRIKNKEDFKVMDINELDINKYNKHTV